MCEVAGRVADGFHASNAYQASLKTGYPNINRGLKASENPEESLSCMLLFLITGQTDKEKVRQIVCK